MKLHLQLTITAILFICQWGNAYLNSPPVEVNIRCSEFTDKYVDKETGVKRFIAKEKIILRDFEGKSSFDLVWFKTQKEYTLALKASKEICFEENVDISFHLLEGKVVTCQSVHVANCESLMTLHFHENENYGDQLKSLSKSEVVGISFEASKKDFKLKVHQKQAQKFQKTLKCLLIK